MNLYQIKTDMELASVYSIPTNYHSRTLLPGYSHLPGGETTATMRFQCDTPGFKGNVQYPPIWMAWVKNVLNESDKSRYQYLFRRAGGIQNSETEGRMEQLGCEGNYVNVIAIEGNKYFISTFETDQAPPEKWDGFDPRVHRITVVNRLDQLTRSTAKEVWFPLMARPGERLWLDVKYLKPVFVSPLPVAEFDITIDKDKSPHISN